MKPKFSLCHTTARPHAWDKAAQDWLYKAQDLDSIEYILCLDERWGFDKQKQLTESAEFDVAGGFIRKTIKVVWNEGRKCSVDGWNTAAAASTGDVIILVADDTFPPLMWDRNLLEAISYKWRSLDDDFVIQTRQGTSSDNRGLITVQMLSRARYERLGYALNPQYEALFADDEFTEHARLENKILDARHLFFEHRHPINGTVPWDEQYAHQNDPTVNEQGRLVLERRRSSGFPTVTN